MYRYAFTGWLIPLRPIIFCRNYIIICALRLFSACINTILYLDDICLTRVSNEHNGHSMVVREYIVPIIVYLNINKTIIRYNLL